MKKKYIWFWAAAFWIASVPLASTALRAEPAAPAEDRETRWQEALDNIQAAIDEDPDEAANFIGSTPVQSLELEELEKLGEKALQFVQIKQIERLQQQQAERRRIREIQDLQRTRR